MMIKNFTEKLGSLFTSKEETRHLVESKNLIQKIKIREEKNRMEELSYLKQELNTTFSYHIMENEQIDSSYDGKIILNLDFFTDYRKFPKYADGLRGNINQTNQSDGIVHGTLMKKVQEETLMEQGIKGKIINFEIYNTLFYDNNKTMESPFSGTPIKNYSSKDNFGKIEMEYHLEVTEVREKLKQLMPKSEININLSIDNILPTEKQLLKEIYSYLGIETNVYDIQLLKNNGFSNIQIEELKTKVKKNITIKNFDILFNLAKNGIKINMSGGNNNKKLLTTRMFNNIINLQKEKYSEILNINDLMKQITDQEIKELYYSSFVENPEDLQNLIKDDFGSNEEKFFIQKKLIDNFDVFLQNNNQTQAETTHKNSYNITSYYDTLPKKEQDLIKKNFSIMENVDISNGLPVYDKENEQIKYINGISYILSEISKVKKENPERFKKIDEIKNKIDTIVLDKNSIPLKTTIEINNLFKQIMEIKNQYNIKERLFFSHHNFSGYYINNDLMKQMFYINNQDIGRTSEVTAYKSRDLNF